MLGLKQVIVVLNKMDLVDFSAKCFEPVKQDLQQWLEVINITPLFCVPISAIKGDNIATKSENMDWYAGPTFLESLDALQNMLPNENKPLLLPIHAARVLMVQVSQNTIFSSRSGIIAFSVRIKPSIQDR